jgi:hypothetical protein
MARTKQEMTQYKALEYLIARGPGRTELELARAIHGGRATQQYVNQDCTMLVIEGKAERRGAGRKKEPYRYWPIKAASHVPEHDNNKSEHDHGVQRKDQQ